MATQKPLLPHSFVAASDMSASSVQYRFVTLTNSGLARLCTATTDIPIGVLQNSPLLGEVAEVCLIGISKLRIGAADIVSGSLVGTDALGRGITLPVGTTGTAQYVVGRVIDTALDSLAGDNDGSLVTALINALTPNRAV